MLIYIVLSADETNASVLLSDLMTSGDDGDRADDDDATTAFWPTGFVLPRDRDSFERHISSSLEEKGGEMDEEGEEGGPHQSW